jgi:HEAT repeat protein
VQIAAARGIGRYGELKRGVAVLQKVLETSEDEFVRVIAANTIREFGEAARPALPALEALKDAEGYVPRAVENAIALIRDGKI